MGAKVRYNDDGSLDEVFAERVDFHLEQMDDGAWWMGITHADGTVDHISLYTKRGAKILARFEPDT